jgi:hypothetical protein
VCTSFTRFANTSVSAISRNLILLFSSMNDTTRRLTWEKHSELQQVQRSVFAVQHTNLHGYIHIHNAVTTLKNSTAVGLPTSHALLRFLLALSDRHVPVTTSHPLRPTIHNCIVLKHIK